MKKTLWSRFSALVLAGSLLLSCFGCKEGTDPSTTPQPTLQAPKDRESSFQAINLIPAPKKIHGIEENGQYKAYEYELQIHTDEAEWSGAVSSFCTYVSKLHALDFSDGQNGILLVKDSSLPASSYKIESGEVVTVSAADEDGIQYAMATMLQIIAPSDDGVFVPLVQIEDSPDSGYRGIMVDLARYWHGFDILLDYVDMCYFYKLNNLHLHFTDSQSYTLPSEVYPKLSSDGRHYHHYTREQIDELVEYAHARGVTLIPEIETPGHCSAFQKAYPKIFGSKGILCAHEETFQALEKLFDELCEMFPYSPYIHLGGDEAYIDGWLSCSGCMKYAKEKGLKEEGNNKHTADKLYAHYVQRVAQMILDNGRKPIAWEGFASAYNDMVSKDVLILSWENYYQTTPDLLAGGFEIINSSWYPNYIVAPGSFPVEDLFNKTLYDWRPVHGGSPYIENGLTIDPTSKVLGASIHVWGDGVLNNMSKYDTLEDAVKEEMGLILERVPALAEITWNNPKRIPTYERFVEIYNVTDAQLKKILADQ